MLTRHYSLLLLITLLQGCAFVVKPVAYSTVFALKVPIETTDAGVNLAYAITDETINVSTTAVDVTRQASETIVKDTMELSGHFSDPDSAEIEGDKMTADEVVD